MELIRYPVAGTAIYRARLLLSLETEVGVFQWLI